MVNFLILKLQEKINRKYVLIPIPLSTANMEGRRRPTQKSKLKKIVFKLRTTKTDASSEFEKDAFIQDMITLISTMSDIPEIFKGC